MRVMNWRREQSNVINRLFSEAKYTEARKVILELLKNEPEDHFLLTCLSSTYYEEMNYHKALEYVEQALQIAPHCPFVLWNYAGTLDMLERNEATIRIYKGLIRRGVSRIAHGECGEGIRTARTMVNDSRYRLGLVYASMGNFYLARKYIKAHINNRSRKTTSNYNLREVKRRLSMILEGKDPRR